MGSGGAVVPIKLNAFLIAGWQNGALSHRKHFTAFRGSGLAAAAAVSQSLASFISSEGFFFPGHLDCQHKSGLHCRRRRRPWHRLVGLQQRRVKHRQHMWPRLKLKLLIKGVVDLSCESLRAAAPAAAAEKKKHVIHYSVPHTQLQSRPKLQFDQTEGSLTTSRAALSCQSWSADWSSKPVDCLLCMF